MGQNFFKDMLYLLRWSFFQPLKLVAYMRTLHPDLTMQSGFSQQLWLAGRSAAARRFLGTQIAVWLVMGVAGLVVMLLTRITIGSPLTLTWGELAFEIIFSLLGSLMVAVALCVVGGPIIGVVGSATGALLLGLSLGLAFGLAQGATAGAALGLSGGIVLGTVAPIFDHLRRPNLILSSLAYWGRALVGLIFTALSVVLFALVLIPILGIFSIVSLDAAGRAVLGALLGLVGGAGLALAAALGMRLESGYVDRRRLRWYIVDAVLLSIVGGIAGSFVVGAAAGITGAVALIVLWAVLVGGGGGIAMLVGNGVSATLAAAGLTWLLLAGPNTLFASTVLLAAGVTLLTGLYSYVRLPVTMVEIPLARWRYLQILRRPNEVLAQLRRMPVYWDDLIFYPLPALDQLLLLALRTNPTAGLREVNFIAQSFRQGWAANRARLAFAAETLAGCNSPAAIANAPLELDWLADELMKTLGQGTSEIVPRLLAIAGGVRVTLNADNLYSRRLGYREALNGLDTLQRRLLSLGPEAGQWWQPVIDRWQRVLLNELGGLDAVTVAVTTENPYQPGNPLPLTRQALFKGRRELRQAVVNALLERHRPTLVLHGPRRMGKTSFLLQLPALLPGHTLPVFLDLQRPSATQSTAAFFYNITRAISRDARPYRLIVEAPQRESFLISPFEAFAEWLEDVGLPALQDFNLLLTFDEFEKLGEAVESGRLDQRIFDELRYLIQHQTRLALLFAGVQTLDELGPAWSSYFINVKPLTIGYLQPDQAEELIRQPDPGVDFNLTYGEAVVAQVMQETACHPYLLQLLCSAIVEESNACQTLHVDQAVLDRAVPRALEQGEPYFRNVWDEMAGPEGQPLLRQIAQAGTPVLPDSPALAHLVRRRVVAREQMTYRIEIPLVRRWLLERAPVSGD